MSESRGVYSFPKSARLLTRVDYRRMLKGAQRCEGSYLILYTKHTEIKRSRLGITVSKKFGNAVERNRFKRLIREAYRNLRGSHAQKCDLLVIPKKYALNSTMADIHQELQKLLTRSA